MSLETTTQTMAMATAATYRRTDAGAWSRRLATNDPPPSDRYVTNPTPSTIEANSSAPRVSKVKSGLKNA